MKMIKEIILSSKFAEEIHDSIFANTNIPSSIKLELGELYGRYVMYATYDQDNTEHLCWIANLDNKQEDACTSI